MVAKAGSSLAKSAPVQIPDPMRRSYSLNFLREKMSDGEIADGMFKMYMVCIRSQVALRNLPLVGGKQKQITVHKKYTF